MNAHNTYVYPNPSQGSVNIRFLLLDPADVGIRIFDIAGKPVWDGSLDRGSTTAGLNRLVWEGINSNGIPVANGVYTLVVRANGTCIIKHIAIVR